MPPFINEQKTALARATKLLITTNYLVSGFITI
jgi:hypothetical protein